MERFIDRLRDFGRLLYDSNIKKLQLEIDKLGMYDLHDVLRQENRVEWCEWHLNIDQNNNAIQIAKKFHEDFLKLEPCSSIHHHINTIQKTFLQFMPCDRAWNDIRDCFKQAYNEDEPRLIVRAYKLNQLLSERLNKHLAVNSRHSLELYCTILNCPILAQSQEYTQAFTNIFFHPKLKPFLVKNPTKVYRGATIENQRFLDNYKEGSTIITTTFLSTSTDPRVAGIYGDPSQRRNMISVFFTYNINNLSDYTALDMNQALWDLLQFSHEEEILIFPYIPFTIKSVQPSDDGQRFNICLDECQQYSNLQQH